MHDEVRLAAQFEEHRPRLRAVSYRMLGSVSEADDAVQEAWLRLQGSDHGQIDNLGGWLTTVVARICLNVLRTRRNHPEDSLEAHVPDPVIDRPDAVEPEHEALLADAIGLALMTVLQTLPPTERLALVLHDSFAVPFEEIATILDKTPAATRQLASRGRRKVQGSPTTPEPDQARQREVVDAFFAASRGGDFNALLALLDPDVVLRSDTGRRATSVVLRGATSVASNALTFSSGAQWARPALVNGAAGVVITPHGRPAAVLAFTVADGRIVSIEALGDPKRLQQLDLSVLD
ncbi:MAG: sigma-70 family RNA polymerase sigma factor [Ilumatobacteraceae bacterium]